MKFFCLTSIIAEGPNISTDIHDDVSVEQIEKRVRKLREYSITEIVIGFDNNYTKYNNDGEIISRKLTYFLLICRDIGTFKIIMEPGTIKIIKIDWEKFVIDLDISDGDDDEFLKLKTLCIRNIKNSDSKEMTEDDYLTYEEYLYTIESYCSINPELSIEDAFENNKMESTGKEKSLKQTIRTFNEAITDLCHPENGSVNNVSDNKRYKDKIPIIWSKYYLQNAYENISIKTQKDFHTNKRKDFNKLSWRKLNFESIKMEKFDGVWFDAINLVELTANNITIAEAKNDQKDWWDVFKGIEELVKLERFVFQASLKEIPNKVFLWLPISITMLELSKNNLTNISPEIGRLINLNTLDLSDNKMLKEDGIPWNSLPLKINFLILNNTAITIIPQAIKRLSLLRQIFLNSTILENVTGSNVNDTVWCLDLGSVKSVEKVNDSTLPNLAALQIRDSENLYQFFNAENFPSSLQTLFLSNNGIERFNFNLKVQNLTSLNLSNNNIAEFPFKFIPKTLKYLNLSYNRLDKLDSIKYWMHLRHFDVSFNRIKSFICDFDNNAYENSQEKFSIYMPTILKAKITNFKDGIALNISNNNLISLPEGLENFTPLKELNIGHNPDFDITDLNESLWNRLPKNGKLGYLCIDGIQVNYLPCVIKTFPLAHLEASGCNLQHICSHICRIERFFVLNITNNPKLQQLPFIHRKVLHPPDAKTKCEKNTEIPIFLGDRISFHIDNAFKNFYDFYLQYNAIFPYMEIIGDYDFRCTKNSKLSFDFKESKKSNNEYFCQCCANCGVSNDEQIVEQILTMDFRLYENKKEINKWDPGTWKSNIKTRLCKKCKEWYKDESKKIVVNLKRKAEEAEAMSKEKEKKEDHQETQLSNIPFYPPFNELVTPESSYSFPQNNFYGAPLPEQNNEMIFYYPAEDPSNFQNNLYFNAQNNEETSNTIHSGNNSFVFGPIEMNPDPNSPQQQLISSISLQQQQQEIHYNDNPSTSGTVYPSTFQWPQHQNTINHFDYIYVQPDNAEAVSSEANYANESEKHFK